jgi:hypothetical protein
MSQAEIDVLAERQRQIHAEGFDEAHDDEFRKGELANAGACYALGSPYVHIRAPIYGSFFGFFEGWTQAGWNQITWPWTRKWWKPRDRRRDLVRAAALIIAEIDRLDREASA